MTILVTGATGFVGKAVTRHLSDLHRKTVSVGRSVTGPGDLRVDLTVNSTIKFPREITSVIHCAGVIPAVGDCDFDDNIRMTQSLIDGLSGAIDVCVLISSVSVYAVNNQLDRVTLTERNCDFTTDEYGLSKLKQEQMLTKWASDNGVRLVVLRPSSIFGPGQRTNTMLPKFCQLALRGEPLNVFAPDGFRQNFVNVDDVADVVVAALTGSASGVFNVFSDDTLSAVELAQRIVRVTSSSSPVVNNPTPGKVPRVEFCNTNLKSVLHPVFRDFDSAVIETARGMQLADS